MLRNYRLPISFDTLIQRGKKLPQISLEESVQRHIFLMLVSQYDSYRFDPSFGCLFWEYDFEPSTELDRQRHQFEESIRKMILKHESRLDTNALRIDFKITQGDSASKSHSRPRSLKKRIEVTVTGRLLETNKAFAPAPFVLYFSPVSIGTNPGSKR